MAGNITMGKRPPAVAIKSNRGKTKANRNISPSYPLPPRKGFE